ncbi:SpaH/EbpB family LPXTG-anchored major pilin [Clostridium sp. Marseille-P3244]|uniref:SpaH/EbpB family LPXTG-anchored major pilin n=1 Tax=Clostridium sp. Marseille-P3244 TaxID=1871020 RepID=UPI000AA84176|nr:SpaH/EbpB family LPXTG-anchored major pilin [Clostridium sp. Marseille-P3244]
MKTSRRTRWAARALALCLIGATAFAGAAVFSPVTAEADSIIDGQTTTGSITITRQDDQQQPLSGATYTIYKIMSLTPGSDGSYASYTVETAFETALDGVRPDALGNYSAQQIEALIDELVTASASAEDVRTDTTEANGVASFTGLGLGYYLVVETTPPEGYTAGSPFLIAVPSTNDAGDAWIYDVTATPKNKGIGIEKEVVGGDDTVAIGDFVQYQITTTIPDYPEEYFDQTVTFRITDVMSDGLEIQNDVTHPIKVTVDAGEVTESDSTYTLTAGDQTGDTPDLTIDFAEDYIKANPGKEVIVTYYAQITEDAVAGTGGIGNEATLTYNNKPGTTEEVTPTTPVVNVYTFNIMVEKFTKEAGNAGGEALQNVQFGLYEDSELQTQIGTLELTGSNGQLCFEGLDEGTYYLKETKALAGYTLLADPIKVKITATDAADGTFTLEVNGQEVDETTGTYVSRIDTENGTAIIAVENHKGFTLPTTGGMGIALFVIIGIAGIAAVSIVITKKTKKN